MRKNENTKIIRKLLEALLREQEESPKKAGVDTPESPMTLREPKARARPAADSVDDQIDALLLRYESASIRKEASLNESLSSLNLKYLLEQEEEPPPEDAPPDEEAPPDDEEEETPPPAPSGSQDMKVTSPADDQNIPDLDIDKFTMRVVRLVNNYNNLLNVEETIVNRTKHFLDENYGEVFVQEFLDNLSSKYGLELQEFDNVPTVTDDNFAVGAFAGGTGGLGGGGGG
tara:strand:- start:485 stop:1174 length:690 start_codon:yes stop_codon:yes gene_type:complete